MSNSTTTPPIMSIAQFCELLGISRTTLERNYLYRKDFPAFRVGDKSKRRQWRIKTADALAYIEKKGGAA